MITFSKFSDAFIDGGKRILKVLQFGAKTADEIAPFGIDSNPIKNMTALYVDTTNSGESAVVGYVNESQLSNKGEVRIYSMDENKAVKSFIWVKNDGSIEFNGNGYSMTRFEPLKQGIQIKDNLINAELAKIATAIGSLGGTYVVTPVSTNIENAKSINLKIE
ncbi:hypothetical protein [Flavobacterium phage V157]|uniref:Uncharacterized protein n=12 Tax=Ficleduovirus FCV1 TaxID=2560474 RepID=A0A218M8J0_9CAUD|nr:hypothetical protein FDG55_gp39 [Flavobacterium phage FCV-1]ASD51623.1 hypothetical protein [Flavobacterium phage FCV-3]ASD51697.1 hypothetical protein [Flavobacterium phage FCV-11]ASD51771.1 hypothetical protein [Flavobacterium phage V175]ASD51849.1 hypothetical protein [Flavobacterium phage V181]ASD52527.1 hypothetical protein [Flavobacterium phage FCV-10]ASD52600.1 hypothetical protein [Flavobacterium phage FCV-16]ASD52674.1 hypothetical protein [Flavobacterium phage FCV-20]ASD52747.1